LTVSGKPFKVVRLNAMEGNEEMLTVETIGKIKLARGRDEKSIGQIAKDFNLSWNTVRKVLRSDATRFEYHRTVQPMPKMEGFTDWVVEQLSTTPSSPGSTDVPRRSCLSSFRDEVTRAATTP